MENQDKEPKVVKWTPEYRKEYQKTYQKEYREKNGEKLAAKDKKWVAENREKWNAYQREYKRLKRLDKGSV